MRVSVATLPMPSIPPPPPIDDYDYDADERLPPTVPPRRPTVASARMFPASSGTSDRAGAPQPRRPAGTSTALPPSSVDRGCFDTTSFIVEQTGKCVTTAPACRRRRLVSAIQLPLLYDKLGIACLLCCDVMDSNVLILLQWRIEDLARAGVQSIRKAPDGHAR